MLDFRFKIASTDHSLFVMHEGSHFVAIFVYVDDVIVVRNNMELVHSVKGHLHDLFKIEDLLELKYFLGLKIARSSQGLHICQKKFALNLLKDLSFVKTHMAKECRLIKEG